MTDRPAVSVEATSAFWQAPPWPTAFELASLLPPASWTLVGGLMVQLHARLANLPPSRTTRDVDCALHLETKATTFAQTVQALGSVGFLLDESTGHAYRFDRGPDRVDVLCSDRYAASRRPRYRGRPLFGIPGGTRALQETVNVTLATSDGERLLVIPSAKGALVMKAAALRADSRDRERHAEDSVLLLACAVQPADLVQGLSSRSRKRLRSTVKHLDENRDPWLAHDAIVQGLARECLATIVKVLG
ncbi:MAG: hypothetical protein QG597_534 [Actinomycetota bacterium]|nr:hypothetical protein [Actinomycetota bacterium]